MNRGNNKMSNLENKLSLFSRIRNSTTTKLATLFTAATFAFAACGPGNGSSAKSCNDDYDCPGVQLCVEGQCQGEGQSCNDDYDCPGEELCEDGVCTGSSTPINKKSGQTNSEGQAVFTDQETGKDFAVYALDKITQDGISGVNVSFTDQNYSNAFLLEKSGYHVVFQTLPSFDGNKADFIDSLKFMFELNPADYTDFTVWDTYHEENPGKINAMEGYLDWAENNYKYVRCMTKEDMGKARDYTAEIISSVSGWKVVSTVYNGVLKLDQWGVIDDLPEEIYHLYEPMGLTNPPLAVGSSKSSEVNDGIDNDCDGQVDESGSSDCEYICDGECCFFSDDFEGNSLNSESWNIYSGSPYVSGGKLVMPGAGSIHAFGNGDEGGCNECDFSIEFSAKGIYGIDAFQYVIFSSKFTSEELGFNCAEGTPASGQVYVPGVDNNQFNHVLFEVIDRQAKIYVNGSLKASSDCTTFALQPSNFSLNSLAGYEFDYIKVKRTGNGGNNSNVALADLCKNICNDEECSGDFDLPANYNDCNNICLSQAGDCSSSVLNQVQSCLENYDCDGNAWLPCLNEIDSSCLD